MRTAAHCGTPSRSLSGPKLRPDGTAMGSVRTLCTGTFGSASFESTVCGSVLPGTTLTGVGDVRSMTRLTDPVNTVPGTPSLSLSGPGVKPTRTGPTVVWLSTG